MTSSIRRFLARATLLCGFALPAAATTFSIDFTDLWYNAPAESEAGWGVNVIQQNEVLFATLFVYGPDGTPRWYVASKLDPAGENRFAGPLYTAAGTYFGAPWAGVGLAEVGTMSFNFNSPTTGVLTYNVGSVTVVKNIVRQSWRIDNLGGNYIGGVTASSSGCFDGTNDPILINGELTVAHAQPTMTMVVDFFNSSGLSSRCTYTGTYSQAGSLGSISGGTYSCSIGTQANVIVGTFTGSEISNSRNGFSGRFNAQDNFCTGYSGFFGGVKDVL